MKAVKIKDVSADFAGEAALYKVKPAVQYDGWNDDEEAKTTNYVVVSAATTTDHGPETYIFPANEEGQVISWGELDGSFVGALNHNQALTNAGYEIS